ncbi:MAG: hypothetical protein WD052_10480 [Bacteroidales bacterium]
MNKAGNILEIIWFVIGGLFLFIGIDKTIESGFGESWHYLLFAILSLLMYLRRRSIRISNK